MNHDVINGAFEIVGAFLSWMNVYRLYKERVVKGVYWSVTAFFGIWGIWNLEFYSHLNQWWSFYGCIMLALGNLVWVIMAIKWRHNV